MPVNDWYPFNPVEWRRDTYHLNVAQRGIYRELIDEYMLTGKPLPDHDASLAGISRATAAEWDAHKETIRAFFKARDGKLVHSRCDRELHAQSMRAAKRKLQAKEAATVRWGNPKQKQRDACRELSVSTANAMRRDATLHNTSISLTKTEFEATGTSEKGRTGVASSVASPELVEILSRKSGAQR